MSRLLQLVLLGLLAMGAAVASERAAERASAPRVVLNQETVVGAYAARYPDVAVFKGIAFAAPPVGNLRWRAPQPYAGRTRVRSAQRFAAACYQDGYNTDWYRRVGKAFGADPAIFSDPPFSEDCLYLNVWTPALGAQAEWPVMVWIHGGSNKAGWSYEPNYQGEALAARGHIVVVSIAYRLGVFGFLGHPQLRNAAAPANFGLLDQIAALHWVRENIRQFGGDPDNVTVAGESAGGADIGFLLTSPLRAGLFRRAIIESGGYLMRHSADLAQAEAAGAAVSKAVPGRPGLADLRRRPSAEIFRAAKEALPGHVWGPVIDGKSLTMSPAAYFRHHGISTDLLIGSNEHEYYMYVPDSTAGLASALQSLPAAARDLLSQRAAQERDARRGEDATRSLADMACPAYLMASAVRDSHRRWVYRFSRIRSGRGGESLLAYHGAEIPYVFDSHDRWFGAERLDAELTTAMLAYWSNFVRTGDPNGAGLAPWPAFDSGHSPVLDLGARIEPIPAPDKSLCDRLAGDLYPGWSPKGLGTD